MKIKFINALVITNNENNEILKNATICVENGNIVALYGDNIDKSGNLEQIENCCSDTKKIDFNADKIIDVQGDVLMPGFVNAHSHNAMILFRGVNDEVSLQEWLYETIFPMEKVLKPIDVYYGTLFACMQSVQCGITTVLDEYFFAPEIIKATKQVGMRAFVPVDINLNDGGDRYTYLCQKQQENRHCFDELRREIAYCHSVYTQSDKQIEDTIKYARENNLVSTIHCSENLEEVGECANKNNQLSPVGYLERLGYFDNPALIAHAVCVDKDDISLLSQYDVSVVTNPASNLKLGSGIAPLQSMLQQKVNVCIGTDGSASNNGIDFFRDMYLTATLQKGVLNDPTILPAQEVLKMATINGAKALGLNNVGIIAPNYKADIIRINTKSLSTTPIHNIVSNIVYSASKSDVIMTMVNGEIVYENGKWTNVENVSEIIEKCCEIAEDLKKRAKIK